MEATLSAYSPISLFDEAPLLPPPGESVFTLRPHQSRARQKVKDCMRKGAEPRARRPLVVHPTGTGKCLGRDTPILMFDGTIKMVQDVAVGDLLMGPDSTPRRVLSVASGVDNLYRITPTKGDSYIVNEPHILSLKITGGAKMGPNLWPGRIVNIPVSEYVQKSNSFKHVVKGWRTGVNWESQRVPLAPYFLGLWLGDGDSSSQDITSCDAEIVQYLKQLADQYWTRGIHLTIQEPENRAPTLRLAGARKRPNPILNALRRLGVLNNKHVPLLYKANDETTRLQLLAGFIDADGCLSAGGYDVVLKSYRLADDIAFVARSLGFAAYIKPSRKTCNGKEFDCWRVFISGDIQRIPVLLPRRKAAVRCQKKDVLVTGIKVEPIGTGEYFGFEIDGDRLFLLGDFTVTHNTAIMASLAEDGLKAGSDIVWLIPQGPPIAQLVKSAQKALNALGLFGIVDKAEEDGFAKYLALRAQNPDARFVIIASAPSWNGERLQRWRQALRRPILLCDEAHFARTPHNEHIILDVFGPCPCVGFTATPKRSDGKNLGGIFDYLADEYPLLDAVNDNRVVPPITCPIDLDPPLDFSNLRITVDGDFADSELEELMIENMSRMVAEAKPAITGRKTLAFTPDIRAAWDCHLALKQAGFNALFIASKYPPGIKNGRSIGDSEREDIIAEFEANADVLVNPILLGVGFDSPIADCLLNLRPTKSQARYAQMVGRVLRLYPGKTHGLIVNFARGQGLMDEIDLYDDSKHDDGTIQRAKEVMEREQITDARQALLIAEDEIKTERELKIREIQPTAVRKLYNPLETMTLLGIKVGNTKDGDWTHKKMADDRDKQFIDKLLNKKKQIIDTSTLGYYEAKQMKKAMIDRMNKGLCSIPQISLLVSKGVPFETAQNTRFEDVNKLISEYSQNAPKALYSGDVNYNGSYIEP